VKHETGLINNLPVNQQVILAGMMIHCYKDTLVLSALGVNPSRQGQGLGSLMMAMLYQYSNRLYLLNDVTKIECNPIDNERTFRFYSRDLRLTELERFEADLPIDPQAIMDRKKTIYPVTVPRHTFFHHPAPIDKHDEMQVEQDTPEDDQFNPG